jgi:hypothetical protein
VTGGDIRLEAQVLSVVRDALITWSDAIGHGMISRRAHGLGKPTLGKGRAGGRRRHSFLS